MHLNLNKIIFICNHASGNVVMHLQNVRMCTHESVRIHKLICKHALDPVGDFGNAAILIHLFTRWHHQWVLEDIEIYRTMLQNYRNT